MVLWRCSHAFCTHSQPYFHFVARGTFAENVYLCSKGESDFAARHLRGVRQISGRCTPPTAPLFSPESSCSQSMHTPHSMMPSRRGVLPAVVRDQAGSGDGVHRPHPRATEPVSQGTGLSQKSSGCGPSLSRQYSLHSTNITRMDACICA